MKIKMNKKDDKKQALMNDAPADEMQELDFSDMDQVAGGGNPFGDVPRPDPNPLDPNPRGNG